MMKAQILCAYIVSKPDAYVDTVAEDIEFDDDRIHPEPAKAPAEVVPTE